MKRLLPILLLLAGCAAADSGGEAPEEPPPTTTSSDDGPDYVTLGPEHVSDPTSVGVGAKVPPVSFVDLAGDEHSFETLLAGKRALVIVVSTIGCPVSKNYHASLQALADRCEEQGAGFLLIDPALQDDAEEIRAKAERMGWTFRITRDPIYALCNALLTERTTDTYVLDADGVMRFHGALDDQYGINYRIDAPRKRYLLDALAAVVADRPVEVPATSAPGCKLSKVLPPR